MNEKKTGLSKRWAATVELYWEHNRLCPSYWEGERFWMGSVEFKRQTALFLSHACRRLLQCLTYMCATVCHCAGSVSLSSPLRLSFINPPRPQLSVFPGCLLLSLSQRSSGVWTAAGSPETLSGRHALTSRYSIPFSCFQLCTIHFWQNGWALALSDR